LAGIGANLLNLTVVAFPAPRQNRGKPRFLVLAPPASRTGRRRVGVLEATLATLYAASAMLPLRRLAHPG
jgi:hypothetical protein